MLTARDITVRYGERTVVNSVSFRVRPGEWWMLVGPNGAGKSSLVRALAQAVPYEGDFLLEGVPMRGRKPADVARVMAVLSQQHAVQYSYTVEELVRLGRYAHERGFLRHMDSAGDEAISQALRDTGLTDRRHASLLALSGGEQQRVFLAQVFAQQPRLMVLDEPANHLDLKYQQQIFGLIQRWLMQGGRSVLSVVHDLSLVRRYGTHALLLNDGRSAAIGPVREVLAPQVLSDVYEMDVFGWMRGLLSPWSQEE